MSLSESQVTGVHKHNIHIAAAKLICDKFRDLEG
jgi:hypothetical protein